MASGQNAYSKKTLPWKALPILLLTTALLISPAHSAQMTTQTLIWDTRSPFADAVDVRARANWKLVPSDLLTLEADPSAACSDPGYYGREYAFEGDAVVENKHIIAVFWSAKGRVVIYSKSDLQTKRLEFVPLQLKQGPAKISHCTILQNTGQAAALEVSFSTGSNRLSAMVMFGRTEIIEIKPAPDVRGISLAATVRYGVVPNFIGDDLIYNPKQYLSTDAICVPSENSLLGLLEGENDVLVVTWPEGQQQVKLALGSGQESARLIESVDLENDGKSIYLALLSAPGIWHKEALTPSYLEKDVASRWKRPFPAKWTTQLDEAGVKTTFTFRESKLARIWRGVAGSYCHPVWFNEDSACYHLSKKILPKGESIVYFLEADNTPACVSTPVDIMKATLGRPMCETILDLPGRKLRTHHRRGAEGIRRACTCGCTEAIEAVFKAGDEVAKQEYVNEAVEDMVYFVRRHIERIDEYQAFARSMIAYLNQTRKSSPALLPYLDSIEAIVQQLPQEYARQRENIKTLQYTDDLAVKTKALTRKKDPANLPACLELGKHWRAMGGAQDGLLGQYHTITRKLFQEAGYGCANQPQAVEIAKEIRRRCTECLRKPDGYEIWPDY
ncbi:MAG TPA: hypothetical protein VMW24_22610 [Sedimentisphaerales bacterium]|nr:hypothetical protein [Sedimentisphaerales bacterium]